MTRIDTPRCLPVANRLESFWLTERDTELQYARTSQELPNDADVVIVGSGLSGAMMSYHLHKDAEAAGRGLRVVMLEADEVCGSATARNGELMGLV
jgi:ribulose 1,5-bisphosphate synthetase/thiazole synthase